MKKLSRKTILDDTVWAVELDEEYGKHWVAGTWNEIRPLFDSPDFSDADLAAKQPEHLREFYDAYWQYRKDHGPLSVESFYKITFEGVTV